MNTYNDKVIAKENIVKLFDSIKIGNRDIDDTLVKEVIGEYQKMLGYVSVENKK